MKTNRTYFLLSVPAADILTEADEEVGTTNTYISPLKSSSANSKDLPSSASKS